jgi:hypothetical protein
MYLVSGQHGRRHDGRAGRRAADDRPVAVTRANRVFDGSVEEHGGQAGLVPASEPDAGDAVESPGRVRAFGFLVRQNDPLGLGAALAEVLGELDARVGVLRGHRKDDDPRAAAASGELDEPGEDRIGDGSTAHDQQVSFRDRVRRRGGGARPGACGRGPHRRREDDPSRPLTGSHSPDIRTVPLFRRDANSIAIAMHPSRKSAIA